MTTTAPLDGPPLARRLLAEALGSALLVVAVVGSGIMAARTSPGDRGLQLLENAAATAGALVGLILMFGPVSGAHLNPVVTLVDCWQGELSSRDAIAYAAVQVAGACGGTLAAHAMFALPTLQAATHTRASGPLWWSEVVATVGLLLVIHGCVRGGRSDALPWAVGAWIGGAYWFTSSTSFANPAVTVARTLTDTFAGIRPSSAPMFVLMQLLGAALALWLVRILHPSAADPNESARRTAR